MPSIAEQKRIVAGFLQRCNRYADAKVAAYRDRLDGVAPADQLALQDKISHWTAYRAFNDHALGELAGTELDDWFEE